MRIAVLLCALFLTSCAQQPDPILQLSRESMGIMQSVNHRTASPEARLTVAQKILAHTSRYDAIIHDPYATRQDQVSAIRFKRAEADMAAGIMKDLAREYIDQGQVEKGRDMYYSMLKIFTGDAYNSTRRSVEAELMHLNEKAQRKAPTQPTIVY